MIELRETTPDIVAPLMFRNMEGDPDVPAGFTFDDLTRGLSEPSWSFIGLFDGIELVGVISMKDNRLHLDICPHRHAKWNARYVIRQGLDLCFRKSPTLVTLVNEHNSRARRIVEAIGFKEFAQHEGYRLYRIHQRERLL